MEKTETKKIEIIAIDGIGREESIKLNVTAKLAKRLANSEDLKSELQEILDLAVNYGCDRTVITKAQFYKIRNFFILIYHKFYNYELSINIL